ncbi:MAG: class II poly(R)-hydroxyalkanoic acid synthase, partial [Pseudomonadota bacterium]
MSEKRTSKNAEDIAENAAENTLALNPIVGVRGQDLFAAGFNVMRSMAAQPQTMMKQWMDFSAEFGKIMTNKSEVAPSPKDRRFADSA